MGYTPHGDIRIDNAAIDPELHPALVECLKAGLLCNDSRLIDKGDRWGIEGDPTEVALITSSAKAGISREAPENNQARGRRRKEATLAVERTVVLSSLFRIEWPFFTKEDGEKDCRIDDYVFRKKSKGR